MHAEIAVSRAEQALEVIEAKRIIYRQRADNAQPNAFVNQTVELRDLDAAQEVTWGDDFMGYELAYVDAEGMAWRLAVRRPLDSDSMTEPYLDCPSCGTTIRAHMAPEVANVNPNDATVAHAEERYRQEIQELRRLRRQHQAALDLCDRADVHDPGHGHWISSNEIRAALGEPR